MYSEDDPLYDKKLVPPPLHGWQIPPFEDITSDVVVLTGSAGSGKSHVAAHKANTYCIRYPSAFSLVVRKTRQSITSSTALLLDNDVVPDWKKAGYPHGGHEKSKSRFVYPNGSYLVYAGMGDDKERENIRSIGSKGGVGFIWIEEGNQLTEDDFNELSARVRDSAAPWRQIMITTNPDAESHWIKKRLIDGGEATVYLATAYDNPSVDDTYRGRLENLSGVLYYRLARGEWVSAEGVVFDNYNSTVSLINRFELPSEWRRIVSIDFGYSNPLSVQWWAFDEKGRAYMYREIYKTKFLIAEAAEVIKAYSKDENIETYVTDHDAGDRATLRDKGIRTILARKDVKRGLQLGNQRFKVDSDGLPRTFLFKDALVEEDKALKKSYLPICFAEELGLYVWDSEGKKSDARKDQPVKKNDHGCDTYRMMIMYVDGKAYIKVM